MTRAGREPNITVSHTAHERIRYFIRDADSIREDGTVYGELDIDQAVAVATKFLNAVEGAMRLRRQREEFETTQTNQTQELDKWRQARLEGVQDVVRNMRVPGESTVAEKWYTQPQTKKDFPPAQLGDEGL